MKWGGGGGVKVSVVGMHRAWSSKRAGKVWGGVCVRVCIGGVCPLSHCSERPLHHASIFIGQVCHIVSLMIVKVKSLSPV